MSKGVWMQDNVGEPNFKKQFKISFFNPLTVFHLEICGVVFFCYHFPSGK